MKETGILTPIIRVMARFMCFLFGHTVGPVIRKDNTLGRKCYGCDKEE